MRTSYLTLLALLIFVQLEAFKGGTSGEKLMAELALMFLVGLVVTVDFLVGLLCFVCESDIGLVGLIWVVSRAIETMRVVGSGGVSYPSQTCLWMIIEIEL